MTDALEFARTTLPDLFARGVTALREDGPPDTLADVTAARGAVRVVVEGEGEVWLAIENGEMSVADAQPADLPPRVALAFEADAARGAIALVVDSGRLDDREAHLRFARSFSARAEKVLAGQKLEFHVIIRDVPDRDDDVVIKVAIGSETPPEKPQFTAAISYDDIEDARAGDLTPQQVIGRLRLTGDASRAMALGMMLMQPPSKSGAKR